MHGVFSLDEEISKEKNTKRGVSEKDTPLLIIASDFDYSV